MFGQLDGNLVWLRGVNHRERCSFMKYTPIRCTAMRYMAEVHAQGIRPRYTPEVHAYEVHAREMHIYEVHTP
jgi:hypothetical protein